MVTTTIIVLFAVIAGLIIYLVYIKNQYFIKKSALNTELDNCLNEKMKLESIVLTLKENNVFIEAEKTELSKIISEKETKVINTNAAFWLGIIIAFVISMLVFSIPKIIKWFRKKGSVEWN